MFKRRGSSLERTVLALIAIAAVAAMITAFRFERKTLNQKLLFYQLQSIRKSVDLFKAIEKRNPEDLKELATMTFSFPEEAQRHRYLESPSMNEQGLLLDPFGHPYFYDAGTGWVKSRAPGYEYW